MLPSYRKLKEYSSQSETTQWQTISDQDYQSICEGMIGTVAVDNTLVDYEYPMIINGVSRICKTPDYINEQIACVGDHRSSVVSFVCDRYIEGHDVLYCKSAIIFWENLETEASGKYFIVDRQSYSANKIKFCWIIKGDVTVSPGVISFRVSFMDVAADSIVYQWSTKPNSDLYIGRKTGNTNPVLSTFEYFFDGVVQVQKQEEQHYGELGIILKATANTTYEATFEQKSYVGECQFLSEKEFYFGNLHLINQQEKDTGEPFCVFSTESVSYLYTTKDGEYFFKFYQISGSTDLPAINSSDDGKVLTARGGRWVPEKPSASEVQIKTDETLKYEEGLLSVNTTNSIGKDNTRPITSAGVFATVGNIEALLKTI